MRRKRLRIISLFLAMMLLLSTAIPITTVFAYNWTPDYTQKYHEEENWFGYQHTKDEVSQWVKEAVKAPTSNDEGVIDMLTGEIRPGDVLSFQVKVEMPTHKYSEIVSLLDTMSFNITLPYGVNAMITAYCDEAPLLTNEQYNQKLNEYNQMIDEIETALNSDETMDQLASGEITLSVLNTFRDLVDNRDKYIEIYKRQLDIGRNKYGIVCDSFDSSSSYGSADTWMGSFEEDPRINQDKIYEEFRTDMPKEFWVNPAITQKEYDLMVEQFNENYDGIITEYKTQIDEIIAAYENSSEDIDDETYQMVITANESIEDGTFYDTVIDYFDKKLNGFNRYGNDENANNTARFLAYILTGQDLYNAYSSQYTFHFPDSIVQRNTACTYIFDINIVATKALSAGTYLSVPMLRFYFGEDCPSQFMERDDASFLHGEWRWVKYKECSIRRNWIDFGNSLGLNNYQFGFENINLSSQDYLLKDKRYLAYQYIGSEYNDDMTSLITGDYFAHLMDNSYLKALQYFTVEYRDENGNIIKSITNEVNDSYYNLKPEEIYDYKIVGPEEIKGVIQNEPTTVTFHYERKDANINVTFVDTEGNELAPTETVSGKTLDEYTTTPAAVYGYEPVAIPDNAAGVLHEDSTDIQYIYDLKDTAVSVNHLDTKGNKISESEIILGKVFDNYHTAPKNIYGYEPVETPNNNSGKMNEDIINVNYVYQLKDSAVTVNYLDDNGNVLAESEIINGKVFDSYNTAAKDIYGYRLTSMPVNHVGEITEESITVNYIYTTKPASVTVNYIDENGSVLSGSEVITGNVFDTYTSEAKDIYGYILINHPESASGIMAEEDISVDYIYRKIFDKLPDEPYKAVYGNKLSDIELPFGWIFEDTQTNPDATVGDTGSNTFTVIVPADEFHSAIRETVTIVVSKSDWIEGVDYDILLTEPYEAEFGDLLSSIKLPKGWIFVNSDGNTTVGEAGINVFDVIVPADKNHPEIKGTITVKVTVAIDEPIVPEEPDDNNADEEKPSEPIVDKPSEKLPNEPADNPDKDTIDNPIINKTPPNDEKTSAISHAEITIDDTDTKTEKQSEKVIINPDTGSNELLIPVVLVTISAAAALFLIICKKRKSAVQ